MRPFQNLSHNFMIQLEKRMKLQKIIKTLNSKRRFSRALSSPVGDIKVPLVSVTDYVLENSYKWAGKPAFSCGQTGVSYTHGEIKSRIESFSKALRHEVGIKEGEVIGLILPNVPEYAIALHGPLKAGIKVTPISSTHTVDEITRQFKDSGVVSIISLPEIKETVQQVASCLKNYKGHITIGDGGQWDLLRMTEPNRSLLPTETNIDIKNVAVLPYSSGTTGLPKGVMISHYNCVSNMSQIRHPSFYSMKQTTDSDQETALSVLPFAHIYGLNIVLNLSLREGLHVITTRKFTPDLYIHCLKEYKPTVLFLVPSLLTFLTTSPDVTPEHLSSVQKVCCGAAPATKTLINLFRTKAGRSDIIVQQGYGLTESSPATFLCPNAMSEDKCGSTGILVPGTEGKVISISTGETLPANESGEILIRGPQVMLGYLNNKKATDEVIDKDGWLHTGDVGHYDEDGYFYITDRVKELIKVKGHQVSPTELESLIIQISGVADAAVIGVPDDRTDEKPMAFIVCTPGRVLVESDVVKYVNSKVAPYKKLTGVRFLRAIPRNPAGKILRKELKALL